MTTPRRILILTADAGFGHRSCANAIAAAVQQRYGETASVAVVNPLDDPLTPYLLRRNQTDYDRFVQAAPQLYDLGYQASDWTVPVSLAEGGLIVTLHRTLREILDSHRPEVIVSTHPYYQAPLSGVFALTGEYVPVLTVVTDLASVHSLWFHEDVDRLLAPTDIVAQRALDAGFPATRIEVTGLPVNPAFADPPDKATARRTLGWEEDRLTILFSGSKRSRKVLPASLAVNHSVLPLQLVLVAGGDETLRRRWLETEWLVPAHVHGFAKNMSELMMASDVIACKAGGLSVSEALAAGLPLIITEVIAGQETGNAELVEREEAGESLARPDDALDVILRWLDRDATILRMRAANARRVGRPEAALRVAELAWEFAERGSLPRPHTLADYASQIREVVKRAAPRSK
jgi:1,2-diacylglycerol 3-beta-galactosyltransferase